MIEPNQIIVAHEKFAYMPYKKVVNNAKQDDKEMLFCQSFNLTKQELAEYLKPSQNSGRFGRHDIDQRTPSAKR